MDDTPAVRRVRALMPKGMRTSSPHPSVLDVRTPTSAPDNPTSAAGRLMNFAPLATIYEAAWRPLFRLWMGFGGPTVEQELAFAVADLGLTDHDVSVVLDVACGPGNFTRSIARTMTGTQGNDPLVVGVDASDPMIARAAADTEDHDHIAYVLADARTLPFEDESVDAVCCYAALYLVPEPFRVLDELIRVLRPGGRIALMTSVRRGPAPVGLGAALAGRTVGLEIFGRDDFTKVLTQRGFDRVEQRIHGAAQFVTGRRSR
ncbi:MAG: class I SAM-dependent methyltransferase [Rhodococcus sp. (in: high G+C Gram-positive bacteria)]